MVADHRKGSFNQFRTQVASAIIYPFEWTVDAPVRFTRWIAMSISSKQHLLTENAELRAEELLLRSQVQRLITLQHENAQLRLLLQSSPQISGRVQVARLLSVDLNPQLLQIIVDKGSNNHVYIGQPVLDAYGVMGQVISVGPLTSKILLITDPRSAVPVKDARSGVRAVAEGLGLSGRLTLLHVPDSADIHSGDLFVSSGLGLRYPVGYPVGHVVSVVHGAANENAQVRLLPEAHLDQTEQVLLAWPSKNRLFPKVQAQLKKTLPVLKRGKNHDATK